MCYSMRKNFWSSKLGFQEDISFGEAFPCCWSPRGAFGLCHSGEDPGVRGKGAHTGPPGCQGMKRHGLQEPLAGIKVRDTFRSWNSSKACPLFLPGPKGVLANFPSSADACCLPQGLHPRSTGPHHATLHLCPPPKLPL